MARSSAGTGHTVYAAFLRSAGAIKIAAAGLSNVIPEGYACRIPRIAGAANQIRVARREETIGKSIRS